MSKFTDGKPCAITDSMLKAKWKCNLCGHRFEKGDTARFVYNGGSQSVVNGIGNIIVCIGCDGPDNAVLRQSADDESQFRKLKRMGHGR